MPPDFENPRPPILIDRAYDDPDAIRALVRKGGPYWPTIRYVASPTELAAYGGEPERLKVVPWFRADWAYGEVDVPGAETILHNAAFVEAARRLFDADVVRPQIVYVNAMGPMGAGPAHIDVPAFRGIDRTTYPVTFLHLMHRSGLFEAHRIDIATAVSWFYGGERGEFEYWADGVSEPPRRIDAPLDNRAVVGDNEIMYHRVAPIGGDDPPMIEDATIGVELVPDDASSDWLAIDEGRELLRYADREVRISVSWKAEVFPDEDAARVREAHLDDLVFDDVIDRLLEDLAARGQTLARPEDPLRNTGFIAALNAAHSLPQPAL
ncbi:MAG: hypothetical protein AAGC67_09715 [Myxococcota bacterium]